MEEKDKIDLVLEWAESNPNFDTTFIESIALYYDTHGCLTDRQIEALDNIIEKFRIDE